MGEEDGEQWGREDKARENTRERGTFGGEHYFHMGGLYYWFLLEELAGGLYY
jgi:hypothetical protein